MKNKKKGNKKGMFIFICILVFIVSFVGSLLFKVTYKAKWTEKFSVKWEESMGTIHKDIAYGDGDANKFDLYLPSDNKKDNYGMVVYLHAGGFTQGDKAGDEDMLKWLCSKGYVAVGINYTLRTDDNNKSVYSQSLEIKEAMPVVIDEAKKFGYNINEMTIAGGSAGGTLAMLYAYRDVLESPVPVKLMFEMVGPSSFYREDWESYGLNQDTEEAKEAAAGLFGIMLGSDITKEQIESREYEEMMKPISSFMWIDKNTVPSVLLYGKYDKVQPYKGVRHLEGALKDNNVDYKLFIAEHSGHGVQNDDKVYEEFMDTVVEYLNKYMPVE